jgi:hypothetical protein
MNTKKLTAIALLVAATLPLTQAAFARDRDDHDRGRDRPAPTWHRDGGDRHEDRGYHGDRDWHRDGYRYRYYRDGRYYYGYYPRRDWDDRRVTVVVPTPPLLLPPPVLLVPKLHDGRIVLRPAF